MNDADRTLLLTLLRGYAQQQLALAAIDKRYYSLRMARSQALLTGSAESQEQFESDRWMWDRARSIYDAADALVKTLATYTPLSTDSESDDNHHPF
jgi:hypothetical protein